MFSFLKPRAAQPAGSSLTPTACLERYEPGATMLDVRTPGEFAKGHLACAVNADILAADFEQKIDGLGLDPSTPVYLYCRSGNRSGQAAKVLRRMGFTDAYNVGSYEALKAVGFGTD